MKKILLVFLSFLFVFVVASCNNNSNNNDDQNKPGHTHNYVNGKCECGVEDPNYDPDDTHTHNYVNGVCECGAVDPNYDTRPWYEKDGNYTLNDFIGGTTSMNWSPLSWETNDDSYVLGYLSAGFYDYQLNEEKDGWEVVCEMASALPTDVTDQYVGQYGISAGEKGKAWQITLNPNAKWENGVAITSADYIYSMKQQLDPKQLNRRADSYYGGDFSVVNAKNYLYNGLYAYSNGMLDNGGDYIPMDQITFNAENGQAMYNGKYIGFKLTDCNNWSPGNGLDDYYAAGYAPYFWTEIGYQDVLDKDGNPIIDPETGEVEQEMICTGTDYYKKWQDLLGENVYGDVTSDVVAITEETLLELQTLVAKLHGFATVEDYAADLAAKGADPNYAYVEWQEMAFYGEFNKVMDFSEVGLFATDPYTIVIVIEKELLNPDFYLPYYLSSTWLVNEELYESCWTKTPEGKTVNTYMTSKATSISYGPYVLSYFEADKQITFTRNTEWYGYTDGKHEGQYQTDKISCQVIEEHKTALLSFLEGKLDSVGMDSDDIKTYGGSEYLVYTPESYTTKFTINTKLDTLTARETTGINKRILTVKEFREAFSLCLDREYFTTAFTAAAAPGYALFNYMYQVINEDGSEETYRNSEAAMQALVNLYGLEYGEGKDYADLDEAYRAITGYDMAKAQKLMQEAYDYAVENGLYTEGEIVKIRFSVYNSDTIYNQMYEYVKAQLNEAVKGTSLEGKIELEMFVDADYYNSLYAGNTDIIFSTWGGATYGTLTTMAQIYCDDYEGNGNQMEIGFNTDAYRVTITLREKEYTYSIKKWSDWLNGTQEIAELGSNADWTVAEKVVILAACEEAFLAEYCAIPLYYRQSASLHSQKINYGSDTYINLIGFGGLRHITYNYTDEAWETYRQGGLDY